MNTEADVEIQAERKMDRLDKQYIKEFLSDWNMGQMGQLCDEEK